MTIHEQTKGSSTGTHIKSSIPPVEALASPAGSMDDYSSSESSSPSYHVYPQGKHGMYHGNSSVVRPHNYQNGNFRRNFKGFFDTTNSMQEGGMMHRGPIEGAFVQPMVQPAHMSTMHSSSAAAYYDGSGMQTGYDPVSYHQAAAPAYTTNPNYGASFDDQYCSAVGAGSVAHGGYSSTGAVDSGLMKNNFHGSQGSGATSNDMYGVRRKGKFRRQAIRLPDAPPVTQQCRRRLPTPEADILERVYIRRIPCKIIEEIIEEPMTPPPKVIERYIDQPPRHNRYVRRVVKVPPRSGFSMYDHGAGGGFVGGQGAFGSGYASGYNVPPVGGASYGYMDSSTSAHGSYSSMPHVSSMPSADYGAPQMSYNSSGYDQTIGNYGMPVGSNLHASFAQPPHGGTMMHSYGSGISGGIGGGGTTYDCYPMPMSGSYGGAGSGHYGGGATMLPGPDVYGSNLGNYAGTPPNLICSVNPGSQNCPMNLCCYPAASGYPGPALPGPPSIPMPLPMPAPMQPPPMPAPLPAPMPCPMQPPPMPAPMPGFMPMPGPMPYSGGQCLQQSSTMYTGQPMQQPMSGGFPSAGSSEFLGYSGSSSFGGDNSAGLYNYGQPSGYGQGLSGDYSFPGSMQSYGAMYPSFGPYGGGSSGQAPMWGGGSAGMSQQYGGMSSGSGLQMYGSSQSTFAGFPSPGMQCPGGFMPAPQLPYTNSASFGGGAYGSPGYYPGNCQMECGRVFRQVIALPEPPPEPIYNRQRLPTPLPDIYERILVCRPPRKVMYNIVEQPTCPPPVVRNQYVMGNAEPPSVMNQVMHVPPKSAGSQGVVCGGMTGGISGGSMYCPPSGGMQCGVGPAINCGGSGLGMYGGGMGCNSGCPSGIVVPCFPCDEQSILGGGYPGMGGGYPGMGGGYPGMGGGYPGMGGGYPGMGGGYPGMGGGYPGIGGGYPGLGGLPMYGGYF